MNSRLNFIFFSPSCYSFVLQKRLHRFDPTKQMSVVFIDDVGCGEGAVDAGGPSKEWLELLLRSCISSSGIFTSLGDQGYFMIFSTSGK